MMSGAVAAKCATGGSPTGADMAPGRSIARAVEHARPMVEVRTQKTRGNAQVPFPLTPKRSEGLAMKWLVNAARNRKQGVSFDVKLFQELRQAAEGKGNAVARRDAMHQLALANQAAAHFRWRVGSAAPPGSIDMDRKQYRPLGRRVVKRLQGAIHGDAAE